jgi:lambda repressor-like predicted transcriptional regulator
MVIPIHYKNVSLFTASEQYEKWWAAAVQPYIVDQEIRIGTKVWVRGDIKIQATAADPLSGMQPLAGDKWAIFGHSQMSLEPIATPSNELPGRMYSTGVITQKSYSKTKIGAKAAFHHITGALLVEITGKKAFIRQLNADSNGHIYDLTDLYTPEGIERDQQALSLTTGDEHVKWMLPNVLKATYTRSDSLINTVRAQYIIRHDVLDGYAGSHHHINHFTTEYKKWFHGQANYQEELDQVVTHINDTTPTDWDCTNVLVKDSNHHEHLDWWLERADDRKDHLNADLICTLRNAQREAIRNETGHSAFELYLKPRLTVPTIFTDSQTPFMLGGVDFSQHGHRGANGSRGSARGFANTTHKATIGHTHSARIVKSVHQVGKSCKTLEYEAGLSSHTNTHSLQYMNGKRTLIDILGLNWHAVNNPNPGDLTIS